MFKYGYEKKLINETQNRSEDIQELIGDLAIDADRNMNGLLKEEGNLTHGLNELLAGTEFTLNEIHKVEMQLKRLDDSINITNDSVEAVSGSLKLSAEAIEDTRNAYIRMSGKMDEVLNVFKDFYSLFELLKLQYNEITGFTNMITSVAQQTRLLSFNASIEAARAGSAGVGFAVVSNEIKKLSDESQKNADDIIESLKNMTETFEKLIEKSSDGGKVVEEAKSMVEESEKLIDGIVDAENHVGVKVTHVKESQSTNLEAVKNITENMANVAHKSAEERLKLNELVTDVNRKTKFYSYILNHLDQIKNIIKGCAVR